MEVIKPGTKQWRDAVKDMKFPGKAKNYRVSSQADAERLLRESKGNMPKKATYTDDPYKKGYEVHPNEAHIKNAPHNDLPHI
jgi:hypothetical protein